MERLGHKIRRIRKEKRGLQQAELADLADVKVTQISYIENLVRLPTPQLLKKIVSVLDDEELNDYELMLERDIQFDKLWRENASQIGPQIVLNCCEKATKTVECIGFSTLQLANHLGAQPARFLHGGASIHVALIEPTMENLFEQVNSYQPAYTEEKRVKQIIFEMEFQRAKSLTSLLLYKDIWLTQRNIELHIRWVHQYTDTRLVIIDGEYCFHTQWHFHDKRWQSDWEIRLNSEPAFNEVLVEFREAYHEGEFIDWNDQKYFGNLNPITVADVKNLLDMKGGD